MKISYKKDVLIKIFMLLPFFMVSLVMYQGVLSDSLVYTTLFAASIGLILFQLYTICYVLFVNREFSIEIDDEFITYKDIQKDRDINVVKIKRDEIRDVNAQIYFNNAKFYSKFEVKFHLKNGETIELCDGFRYKFDEKRAKEITKYLLSFGYGNKFSLKFHQIVKERKLKLDKEQVFMKKEDDRYYVGLISNDKDEFKSIKRQLILQYYNHKTVVENRADLFIVENEDSYINAQVIESGYFIELYKVESKPDIILKRDVK